MTFFAEQLSLWCRRSSIEVRTFWNSL